MSERKTAPIICARAPRHIVYVPAVRGIDGAGIESPDQVSRFRLREFWRCSWCGARVKVVA